MSKLAKALTAAAGNAAGESLYVEDVFSTYLYEGNGATQTITNGIDLDGEGGLVWSKKRSGSEDHVLFDTEAQKRLVTNTTASGGSGYIPTYFNFLADGYFMDWSAGGMPNDNGDDYASWTFRKAEKFFDVVTYTGDGSGDRVINHSLNSTPASIIMKKTSATSDWPVYHTGAGTGAFDALALNQTSATGGILNMVVGTSSSSFTVRSSFNDSGVSYVAYLFASDAGGFGDDDESIIKCGSYTGTGAGGTPPVIDLGFEPQWLLVKQASAASGGNWMLMDTMRGWGADGSDLGPQELKANTSDAEFDWGQYGYDLWTVNPTGFTVGPTELYNLNNESGATYIYIAIRRPMKTPESGEEVFAVDNGNGTSGFNSGFPVDMGWRFSDIAAGSGFQIASRLNAKKNLYAYSSNAENNAGGFTFDSNIGWGTSVGINTNDYSWMFKRATGFFDVVAYTGDGVAGRTVAHNLGVAPELMIVKSRSNTDNWAVYDSFNTATHFMNLELSDQSYNNSSRWNGVEPTSEVFTVGTHDTNLSGYTYIAYLFATLAGVSKVGSYTGTGSNVDVDCGFSAGARFILIKRTDSTGDWYVWDSVRGIVAGNDPYLLLNSTAAEVTSTDYIDPLSSGFTVTSTAPAALNASGGSYIFLAIS